MKAPWLTTYDEDGKETFDGPVAIVITGGFGENTIGFYDPFDGTRVWALASYRDMAGAVAPGHLLYDVPRPPEDR